jgi:hypothetical protein
VRRANVHGDTASDPLEAVAIELRSDRRRPVGRADDFRGVVGCDDHADEGLRAVSRFDESPGDHSRALGIFGVLAAVERQPARLGRYERDDSVGHRPILGQAVWSFGVLYDQQTSSAFLTFDGRSCDSVLADDGDSEGGEFPQRSL